MVTGSCQRFTAASTDTGSERCYHSTSSVIAYALSSVLSVGPPLGALVHNVDAVPSAIGDGVAEPEGHHDDGHNPQEVEGEPKQTQ